MSLLKRFTKILGMEGHDRLLCEPEQGYDLWSQTYDSQPGNLMFKLDEAMFGRMLEKTQLGNKVIADVGCGTGRHWTKLIAGQPMAIVGFDVSMGMLDQLKMKYPGASAFRIEHNLMPQLASNTVDLLVSTLTLAHIDDIEGAITEWRRVLRNRGEVIITDYHPLALSMGGDRTFPAGGRSVAIRNVVHPVEKILSLFDNAGFELEEIAETEVDSGMRHYYERANALHVYNKFVGIPIIFGMKLKKRHVTA